MPYSGIVTGVLSDLSVDLISSMIPVDPDAAALISSTEIFEERSIPNSFERTPFHLEYYRYISWHIDRELMFYSVITLSLLVINTINLTKIWRE